MGRAEEGHAPSHVPAEIDLGRLHFRPRFALRRLRRGWSTTGINATKYPAAFCQYNLATSIPLTNDWTALNAAVDTMIASGNTNVTMGVAWGWASLSEDLPLPKARPPIRRG